MSEGALAAQPQRPSGSGSGGEAQQLADLCSLDHSSRADSTASALSQGSGSVPCEHGPALPCNAADPADGGGPPAPSEALAADAAQGGPAQGVEQCAAPHPTPPRRVDAKSSALKALAGVSAVVSKSRKVDAEALQTIKMQRAKARAEGHAPGHSAAATRAPPPAPTGVEPAAASPSAAASSQALGRAASTSSLPAPHSQLQSHGSATLGHAAPLPVPGQARMAQRRSPPPTPPQDLEALVSRMTISELVSLKQAVEGQLAKQAMALAQLQAGGGGSGGGPAGGAAELLSAQAQYATLVLQSAQQAQLAQQLASQQQAAALQQALPQPLGQFGGLALPGGELSTPFACAPFPADAAFGPGDGGRHPALGLAQAAAARSGSASAEQLLLGDALHSFLDPERQGPPSRQGSTASASLGWGDRRASGVLPSGALPPASRSRSLPAAEARFPERSPSLGFLAAGNALDADAASVADGMPGFFGGLRAEPAPLDRDGAAATPFGGAPSRSGSLAAPLQQLPTQYHLGQQLPYADPAHLHSFHPLR